MAIKPDVRTAILIFQNGEPKIDDGLCFFCYEDNFEEFKLPLTEVEPYLNGPSVKWQFENTNYLTELIFNHKEITVLTGESLETSVNKTQWNNDSTKHLIEFYKEYKEKVDTKQLRSVKKMWELIAQLLEEKGFVYTPLQIENRWKTLERAYKRMVLSNKNSGLYIKHCAFEKELEDILKDKVTNNLPVFLAESGGDNILRKSLRDKEIKHDKSDSISPQKLISELEKLRQEISKKEKAKQKRHEEKMVLLREQNKNEERKLELFEKLLEKWA